MNHTFWMNYGFLLVIIGMMMFVLDKLDAIQREVSQLEVHHTVSCEPGGYNTQWPGDRFGAVLTPTHPAWGDSE
jgi:hypothetical protein